MVQIVLMRMLLPCQGIEKSSAYCTAYPSYMNLMTTLQGFFVRVPKMFVQEQEFHCLSVVYMESLFYASVICKHCFPPQEYLAFGKVKTMLESGLSQGEVLSHFQNFSFMRSKSCPQTENRKKWSFVMTK